MKLPFKTKYLRYMKLMKHGFYGKITSIWPKKRKRHGTMTSTGIMASMGDKQWKVIKDSYLTFFQSNKRERERERERDS